jgi:hypothetical protein
VEQRWPPCDCAAVLCVLHVSLRCASGRRRGRHEEEGTCVILRTVAAFCILRSGLRGRGGARRPAAQQEEDAVRDAATSGWGLWMREPCQGALCHSVRPAGALLRV